MSVLSRPPLLPDELTALAALAARSGTLELAFASAVPALEGVFARPGLDPQEDALLWLDRDKPVVLRPPRVS